MLDETRKSSRRSVWGRALPSGVRRPDEEFVMKIVCVGQGKMGAGMAANLQKARYAPIVHDVLRKAGAGRGAPWADSPQEVARACDVVLASLPVPREVESVSTRPNGVLEGISAGKVYTDLNTGYPASVRRIHQKFAEAGARMMDPPVNGSTIGAKTGHRALMVGGEDEACERRQPVLDTIGDRLTHTGGIGSGTICKLAHNCPGCGAQTIAAECCTPGVKAGASPGAAGNVAYQETIAGLHRGWGEDGARRATALQEERAGGVRVRISEREDASR